MKTNTTALPPLAGTPAQIEWATRIRQSFADSIESKRTYRLSTDSLATVKTVGREYLASQSSAAWWINEFKLDSSIADLIAFPFRHGLRIDGREYIRA